MQVNYQSTSTPIVPSSHVEPPQAPSKPVSENNSPQEIKPLSDKYILQNVITSTFPLEEVYFGTPEELVHETVQDVLRARENGKGHWCGTPMMMDIMRAHSRFDSMVAKQDSATLENLRDYIVEQMSGESSSEARSILHTLYQSVDRALTSPAHDQGLKIKF